MTDEPRTEELVVDASMTTKARIAELEQEVARLTAHIEELEIELSDMREANYLLARELDAVPVDDDD